MKYALLAICAALILSLCSSCSFLARGRQIVAVTVTPADAFVIANGVEYHTLSPMFIEVPTRDSLLITAYKPGYRTVYYAADSELSSTGKLDALGAIIILPATGLLSNGAWRFTESNIVINLQPLPDPEESALEQEATQRRRQDVARELAEEAASHSAVPLTDATARSSDIRTVDKTEETVTSQDPLDKHTPADPEDISIK